MMIYFDNASTTKPHQAILDLYVKVNNEYWYNESSTHHLGQASKTLLEKAQNLILKTLNLKNKKVIFTSSATEANNLAIYGICSPFIGQNKHIITSKIEHPSVLACFKDLEKQGFRVTYLDVDSNGIIKLDDLKSALTKDTILVSIMWVNNIIGSIQPVEEIATILKDYPRVKFHSDLVQGLTKLENLDFNQIDLMTFTAHKIHGIKGTGALIISDNVNLTQITKGGHQQNEKRAGTVDVAGCVCLAKALEIASNNTSKNLKYVFELYQYLLQKLNECPFVILNKSQTNYSPYVLNFSLKNLKGETFMHFLEQHKIYLGYGSACNAKAKALEQTLMATYNDQTRASNAVRISLSEENTKEEIDFFIEKLKEVGNR